jgi:predicted TIM-barrel fold metal-dependent hydrolase
MSIENSIIDSHQHLLYPTKFNYQWVAGFPVLQKAFKIQDYWDATKVTGIAGSIFVEVDVEENQQGDEARFICELAEKPEAKILGVIASGRPENSDFKDYIRTIKHPKLKGIRRIFHTISGELPINHNFLENVKFLGESNLSFDICALPEQFHALLPLIEHCPETSFIVNHCGIPPISSGDISAWKEKLAMLAAQPNVYCKVSGIVAYCNEGTVSVETLRPWFDNVVELFGHERLIFGGDWPVCNLSSSIASWKEIAAQLINEFDEQQKQAFWSLNAISIYKL